MTAIFPMRLLIDNDFYIKLELAGLLDRTLALLACTLSDSRRLPDLVPQFRGKKWRTKYGDGPCRILREKAEQIDIAPEPTTHWLEQFVGNPAFNPGEAMLLALAAETPLLCLGTADKRAMRAVPSVPGLVTAMAGKLVAIEHVCLALCETWGVGEIKRCFQPTLAFDKQLQSCFSCDTEAAVREGLRSYARSYEAEIGASMFWRSLGPAPVD